LNFNIWLVGLVLLHFSINHIEDYQHNWNT
jgi:hypothetical protein